MTKNLETADTIVKLVLCAAILVFYFAGIFEGPFAQVLVVLSVLMIIITTVRFILHRTPNR